MTVISNSVAITTVGCSVTCAVICPHTHTESHNHTWYKNRQQLFDGVHGVDEHLSVFLMRQLLLPLLDHLWHFGHPWREERKTGRLYLLWKVEVTNIKETSTSATNGRDLGFVSVSITVLIRGRGHPPVCYWLSSSNTSKQIITSRATDIAQWQHQSSVRKPWHHFLQLIMPQCSDNTIDLLPVMINSLFVVLPVKRLWAVITAS